ncbi:MAG: hypothetical protein ABGY96_17875 [bacterium]|nr:hypothetical protein [Gammaproteobacteria bacterium]HIL95705.1 hypothetical protein [Pseudomonadales bacterium]
MAGEIIFDTNGDGLAEIYSIGAGLPDKVTRRADGNFIREVNLSDYIRQLTVTLQLMRHTPTIYCNWVSRPMGAITVGVKNIANEEPPKMNTDDGYDAFSGASPIGRIYYAKYIQFPYLLASVGWEFIYQLL